MTFSWFLRLVVKITVIYIASVGLIVAVLLSLFWLVDRVYARWQAWKLQAEIERVLKDEASR